MSRTLALQLSDELYAAIARCAETAGTSPAHLATASLAMQFGIAQSPLPTQRPRSAGMFEQHFGSVDLGHPTGSDNEGIDADLGREYAGSGENV